MAPVGRAAAIVRCASRAAFWAATASIALVGCGATNGAGSSPGDGTADPDADGFTNAEEEACASDPADPLSTCYRCGWQRRDPGDLVATGNDEGATLENAQLVDRCGEAVPLWDFAGAYHILFATGAW
jgi:hypothetical protein